MKNYDSKPKWLRMLLSSPEYKAVKKLRARSKPSKKTYFAGKNKGKKGKKAFKRAASRHHRSILGKAFQLIRDRQSMQKAA